MIQILQPSDTAFVGTHVPALDRSLAPCWSSPVRAGTGLTGFLHVGGVACLVDDRSGIVEVGTEPLEDRDYRPWIRWDFALDVIGTSWDGAAILTRQSGDNFAWRPGAPPVFWWRAPGGTCERSVDRIAEDLAVVTRWDERTTALWRVTTGERIWQLAYPLTTVLAAGGYLLVNGRDRPTVCLEVSSGRRVWDHECSILGIVDDVAWLSGLRRIVGVDLASGATRHDVAVEVVSSPDGVIDAAGVLHIAKGLSYQQLDLRAGGARRCLQTYSSATLRDAPTEANGLPTADGRFVFFDHKFGLWVIHPDEARTLEPVWKIPSLVFHWTIAHGAIYALDEDRNLHCIGDPARIGVRAQTPVAAPRVRAIDQVDEMDEGDEEDDEPLRPSHRMLATDEVIDGMPCRGGTEASFFPDGSLSGGTLAADLVIGVVDVPAGSRFAMWELEDRRPVGLVHAVWLALDRVVHGVRLVAGTEIMFRPDGRTVGLAILAADTVVAGRRLRKGTTIYQHDGAWEREAR